MCKGKSAFVTGLNYNRHRPNIPEIQGERHIPTRWILVVFWIDRVTGSTHTLVGKWFNISRVITICLHWYVIRWVLKMRTLPTFTWPIKRYPKKNNVMWPPNNLIALVEARNTGNASRTSDSVSIGWCIIYVYIWKGGGDFEHSSASGFMQRPHQGFMWHRIQSWWLSAIISKVCMGYKGPFITRMLKVDVFVFPYTQQWQLVGIKNMA